MKFKLTYEDNGSAINLESVAEGDFIAAIRNLDPIKNPFVILEDEDGNFIQCAGSTLSLAVEARFYTDHTFTHFIIGKKELSRIWSSINSKIGPIRVLQNEELDQNNALELFSHFYHNNEIKESYNKRNITKQFR